MRYSKAPQPNLSGKPGDLLGILEPLLPPIPPKNGFVIATVGGGGKTATLFNLALAGKAKGLTVALTTTTHIRDPRLEKGRIFDDVIFLDESGHKKPEQSRAAGITVICTSELAAEGKFQGISLEQVDLLRHSFDLVLVEADGSRGLPIKAPAAHEPVVPPEADLVIGVVGLDCLGKPMDKNTVHRPALFGPLCGCAPGEAINASHVVGLCQAKDGLFKHSPPRSARVLILNKANILASTGSEPGSQLAELYRNLQILNGSLSGMLICSLEPIFELISDLSWLFLENP